MISIVICTWKYSRNLRLAIQSIEEQSVKGKNFELIIVDNSISGLVKEKLLENKHNYTLLHLKEPGLAKSRNLGWKHARGKYVAYLDDDATADRNWITEAIAFIKSNPGVVAFGGPYSTANVKEVPGWFPREALENNHGGQVKSLKPEREWISGTNMFFKKNILEEMSGFNEKLGMKGTNLGYSEETELQERIREKGYDIYYVPSLKVKHHFSEKKTSLAWLLKSAFANGVSTSLYNEKRPFYSHFISLIKSLIMAFITFVKNIPSRMPLRRNIYYATKDLVIRLGELYGDITNEK